MKSKKATIIILALILILSLALPSFAQGVTSTKSFTDIKNHWAESKITDWINQGFISGYKDGTFKPNNSITRAEFASLANKALSVTEKATVDFKDVSKTDWYYKEIAKAVAAGYFSGYEDGTVKPNNPITRAEAAAVITKALNLSAKDSSSLEKLTDVKTIADWAKPAINQVISNNFMAGYPDGSFKAGNKITRAESVVLLDRIYQEQGNNYDKPGTYGPATGIKTIKKHVNINEAGVTLQNMVIEDNLYFNQGIGEGDAHLNNVTVKGKTIVKGGGQDSIYLANFNGEEITVNKIGSPVRIVILDNSSIATISLETNAIIEIPATAKITNLILDAPATVTGKGEIEKAQINVNGAKLETPPIKLEQAENVTTEIAGKEVPEGKKEQQLESISMSVILTPEVLPEGGGQTVTIAVTVTDKAGNPVEDAKVVSHAFSFESGERNAQLSQSETTTDASGKAIVTYTTLLADDKKMVEINVTAFKDSAMEHGNYKIMAANQAAVVCGILRDPYTGAPKEDVHIHFISSETNKSIGGAETDDQGHYSMVVPTGTYHISFEMAMRDQITVNASSPGQTYTIDNNKGILKGVIAGVSPGRTVMAIGSGFNRNSPDNWTLQAEIQSDGSFTLGLAPNKYELFITGNSTPFKTGVTVQSGQVTDIGTVNTR